MEERSSGGEEGSRQVNDFAHPHHRLAGARGEFELSGLASSDRPTQQSKHQNMVLHIRMRERFYWPALMSGCEDGSVSTRPAGAYLAQARVPTQMQKCEIKTTLTMSQGTVLVI